MELHDNIGKNQPLRVQIVRGRICISVGIETLAYCQNQCLNMGEFCVTESKVFAEEMVQALKKEEEDGTTLVHELFDAAGKNVFEQGGLGCEEL